MYMLYDDDLPCAEGGRQAMNWEVTLSLTAQVLLINNMYIQIVSVNSKATQ